MPIVLSSNARRPQSKCLQVETLKLETRQRLLQNIDARYDALSELKSKHESEIEMVTRQIDHLHEQLEEAMKSR